MTVKIKKEGGEIYAVLKDEDNSPQIYDDECDCEEECEDCDCKEAKKGEDK